MTTYNFNINDLLSEITHRIGQLEDALEGQPVTEQVEIGAALWAVTERAKRALEFAKKDLRAEAEGQLGGPGTHTFSGVGATEAMVTIPKPSLRLQKDVDIGMLKGQMGSEFDRFFDTVTSYAPRSEFAQRRASATDAVHGALLDKYVELVPNTPRVTFRRMDHAQVG